jgi:hypothetical protein
MPDAWTSWSFTRSIDSIADAMGRPPIAALDESFFRVRFDRLTPGEKRYLRSMADGAAPRLR